MLSGLLFLSPCRKIQSRVVIILSRAVTPLSRVVLRKLMSLADFSCRNSQNPRTFLTFERMKSLSAVLVAIAIPVFTTQLEKSREATDMANVRSAYASVVTQYLEDGTSHSLEVSAVQTQSDWQTSGAGVINGFDESGTQPVSFDAAPNGTYTVAIDSTGVVSVTSA